MRVREDKEQKEEMKRERERAMMERRRASEGLASSLTSDLRGVYGLSLLR
ncbi:MAG: hypothetical protein MUE76_06865 [Syntrophales bacterium]|jgi:hypothetical protein|nr:hypothetical protein [Syntrophales bacterium]